MTRKVIALQVAVVAIIGLIAAGCAPEGGAPAEGEEEAAPAATGEVYNWKSQECWPRASLALGDTGWQLFCEKVKKATGGRLDIESYPVGELVQTADVPDSIQKGILQMSPYSDGFFAGTMPLGNVAWGLPLAATCPEDVFAIYERGMGNLLREGYAEHGIHYVTSHVIGRWGIVGSNVPLRTLEDFDGVKIRIMGANSEVMEKLGATPVAIAPEEIYTAMQLGTVDAIARDFIAWSLENYGEVSDYMIASPVLCCPPLPIIVNPDSWNELPQDIRDTFLQVEREHALHMLVEFRVQEEEMFNHMPEGALINMAPEEAIKLRNIAVEVWDEYAEKSPRCAQGVKIVKDYCLEQGYIT